MENKEHIPTISQLADRVIDATIQAGYEKNRG